MTTGPGTTEWATSPPAWWKPSASAQARAPLCGVVPRGSFPSAWRWRSTLGRLVSLQRFQPPGCPPSNWGCVCGERCSVHESTVHQVTQILEHRRCQNALSTCDSSSSCHPGGQKNFSRRETASRPFHTHLKSWEPATSMHYRRGACSFGPPFPQCTAHMRLLFVHTNCLLGHMDLFCVPRRW